MNWTKFNIITRSYDSQYIGIEYEEKDLTRTYEVWPGQYVCYAKAVAGEEVYCSEPIQIQSYTQGAYTQGEPEIIVEGITDGTVARDQQAVYTIRASEDWYSSYVYVYFNHQFAWATGGGTLSGEDITYRVSPLTAPEGATVCTVEIKVQPIGYDVIQKTLSFEIGDFTNSPEEGIFVSLPDETLVQEATEIKIYAEGASQVGFEVYKPDGTLYTEDDNWNYVWRTTLYLSSEGNYTVKIWAEFEQEDGTTRRSEIASFSSGVGTVS